MRAATIGDGNLAVDEHPDPEPGAGEVLVRVRAAGPQRRRHAPAQGRLPGAARLAAGHPGPRAGRRGRRRSARAPTRFAEGDRVMAIVGGGGQAELAVVHERQLMPVPDGARLAGRPAACPRSSRPPTTRSSRRAG